MHFRPAIVLSLVMLCGQASLLHAQNQQAIQFERDILPIFKAECYKCHDEKKAKAGLRIDQRSSVLRGGESGKPAIVAGQSAKSELIRRVTSKNVDEVMPPKGERLSDDKIKLLRQWIDSGAVWPDALAGDDLAKRRHWAFQPPARPNLPSTSSDKWVRNPIDRFALARLEKEGLKPSAEAERATLIRRLSLDLIGLPPTPAEVDAFLADKSDRAHENLIDRLLKSPHYGEKLARNWLDAARYADSDGYEKDKSRSVWFYRDWVINSLNRDMPYSQFIIEQIAGDLLPNATQDQKVATGFLRNSMINEEGGVDPEQFRMDAMFDRMDAIGKSILGLGLQCCQCHNHKFDPISQQEYYGLFAFLNNDHEANMVVYTPQAQMQRADLLRQIREMENDLRHRNSNWRDRMAAWEENAKKNQPAWQVVRPEVDPPESDGGQKYLLQADGSILAMGYAPTKHTVQMKVKTEVQGITAFRLELLNDPNLPLSGPGRSPEGTGALTEFKVQVAPADAPNKKEWVKFVKATADVNPPEKPLHKMYDDKSGKKRVIGPVSYAIDGKDETAWGIDVGPGRRNQPRKAVFLAEKPISHPKGTILTFHLTQNHGGWNSDDNQNHNLGRFRLSVTTQQGAEADPLPNRVREIISRRTRLQTPAELEEIFSYWRTTVPEWKEVNDKIELLWQKHPLGDAQLVLQPREEMRRTSLLKRGDFLKPDKQVGPGVPSLLHALPADEPLNRLTFARWLVDNRSPTTARVIVNRVWQSYFGVGLVSTSEDLGTQCEPPSHRELLDWLAVEFMDKGWSLKELHKLIASSATYRQSSKVTAEMYSKDPYNRLLARGSRFRVDAEIVRDLALMASGLLNPAIGGRSVFPPLPEFMMQPPVSYGPKIWPEEKGPERYKRSLYTFRYRSIPYPVLQTFDAPNGDYSCVRRTRSNTPLQALMTLNEPIFVECAQALAAKTLADGGNSDADRLNFAFRRCLSRIPTSDETAALVALLEKEKTRFSRPGAKPTEIAGTDQAKSSKNGKKADPTQLAAWTIVSRVLLNLDETITKE